LRILLPAGLLAFEKGEPALQFHLARRPPVKESIGAPNAARVVWRFGLEAVGEPTRFAPHQIAVEKEKTLKRHVRYATLVAAQGRIGKIEQPEYALAAGAPDPRIHGPLFVGLAVDFLWRSAHPLVARARHKQQRIANCLGIEPPEVGASEQRIAGVDRLVFGVGLGA